MQIKTGFKALCILFAYTVAFSGQAAESLQQFSRDQVEDILRSEGYSAIKVVTDKSMILKIDGTAYGITVYDDGDIQCTYVLSTSDTKLETVNAWNQEKRLSRAYLDDDNDPTLEVDLDADAGVTEKHVARLVRLCVFSASRFKRHLEKN